MPVLYLTEQGSALRKKSHTLLVEKEGSILSEIELHRLEAVMVFGNVQLTTQAIRTLLDAGIETAFFTLNGRLKGRLVPPETGNVTLRLNQYRTFFDPTRSLENAKRIVLAKLKNARRVLDRYLSNYPDAPISTQRDHLIHIQKLVMQAPNLAALNGIEGTGAATYFDAFAHMCRGGAPLYGPL